MKRILHFLKYNMQKKMTVVIYLYLAYYRFLLMLLAPTRLQRYFGTKGQATTYEYCEESMIYARLLSKMIYHIANQTPWESKCLVRALAAQKLMRKKNIPTTLYLGVGKDEQEQMIAHAWLRYGDYYMTGGSGEGYTEVARFRC